MSRTLLFIGGCNRTLPYFETANGKGIAAFHFDDRTGELTPAAVTEGIDNPTFIAIDPTGRTLYATSEVFGWNEGTVTAYDIDPETGRLDYINKQPTRGSIAAQLSFDRTGRYLFCVNYSIDAMTARPNRSVIVFPRRQDGGLDPIVSDALHEGHGPDAARQDRSHPHCAVITPNNRFLIVTDLGMDQLVIYRFDAQTGSLEHHGETVLPGGSGPRHVVVPADAPFGYVVNELNSTVASLTVDQDAGTVQLVAVEPTLPSSDLSRNHCSEICITPDGTALLVANRGADCLSLFRIDRATGIASFRRAFESGGRTPRHFCFDPTGTFIAVANQDSDTVSLFSFDGRDHSVNPIGSASTGTPTAVVFLPAFANRPE